MWPSAYGSLAASGATPTTGMAAAGTGTAGAAGAGAGSMLGPAMFIMGAISSGINSYYAAKMSQTQAKYAAITAENQYKSDVLKLQNAKQQLAFQADISKINAEIAEFQAQQIMHARNAAVAQYTMKAGQARGSARAAMASRGGTIGYGSSQEVLASMDYITELDTLEINASAVRNAEAARMQKTGLQIQANLTSAQSQGMFTPVFGGTMPYLGPSPMGAAFSSLLGSASSNPQVAEKTYDLGKQAYTYYMS